METRYLWLANFTFLKREKYRALIIDSLIRVANHHSGLFNEKFVIVFTDCPLNYHLNRVKQILLAVFLMK
jgi:hypothetical protein